MFLHHDTFAMIVCTIGGRVECMGNQVLGRSHMGSGSRPWANPTTQRIVAQGFLIGAIEIKKKKKNVLQNPSEADNLRVERGEVVCTILEQKKQDG